MTNPNKKRKKREVERWMEGEEGRRKGEEEGKQKQRNRLSSFIG